MESLESYLEFYKFVSMIIRKSWNMENILLYKNTGQSTVVTKKKTETWLNLLIVS